MRLSGQFQVYLFLFYEKILNTQKRKSNQNQLTKQKQANKKQQKQQLLARTKSSKRVKIVCFAFWSFFYTQNLFVKKINILEIVLITSPTLLLIWVPKKISWILPLLVVRHRSKLLFYSISRKTNASNLRKWLKT